MFITSSHKKIRKCLDFGINIDLRDEYGNTALIHAVNHTSYKYSPNKIVTLLCEKGADVNLMNYAGRKKRYPEKQLFFVPHEKVMARLQKFSLNMAAKFEVPAGDRDRFDMPDGGTLPLIIAAENNHAPIVELLVENGANVAGVRGRHKC